MVYILAVIGFIWLLTFISGVVTVALGLWSAEILCGPFDGERCGEYGMIRECAAPSLLSCGW